MLLPVITAPLNVNWTNGTCHGHTLAARFAVLHTATGLDTIGVVASVVASVVVQCPGPVTGVSLRLGTVALTLV